MLTSNENELGIGFRILAIPHSNIVLQTVIKGHA